MGGYIKEPSAVLQHPGIMKRYIIAALGVALLFAQLSFGHAILLGGKPAVNGLVAGPNIDVELQFNSRVDTARSRLTLVLPDQTARQLQVQPSSAPATLAAHATGLGPGEYRLRWQVLANDGHITRGEFTFHVK
jgi:methionine-rich copper-binding protein CopC